MTQLPKGWARTPIGAVCDLINGRAFKPSDWSPTGLPIVRIQNLNNPEASFNRFNGEVRSQFLIDSGQLLFAWSGTPGTSFGAHIWTGGRGVLNQHIFRVEFSEELFDKLFLRFAINQKLEELIGKAHGGVGLRHVTKSKFEETEIPLPPLAEQRRIVAKLEALTARTARARSDLKRVPILAERQRQAILVSAFSGRLTAGWRGDPLECNADALPRGWSVIPFGELCVEGPSNGWSPPSSDSAAGALSLKLTATTSGTLRLDDAAVKRIATTPPPHSKYWLKDGDLLIQRANALEHVGATAIFAGPDHTYIYPDLMMRVRMSDAVTTRYCWRFLNSSEARTYFRRNATGTAGNMPKINGQTLRSLPIRVPPEAERAEIVRRIDHAFAEIDRLVAEATAARCLLDRLDQAILSKAFRGELVPQDPADEAASALLDRIRAERAAGPAKMGRGLHAKVA